MNQEQIDELYGLIADINPTEITGQIKADNFSMWCNSWRITAKAALRTIETEVETDKAKPDSQHNTGR